MCIQTILYSDIVHIVQYGNIFQIFTASDCGDGHVFHCAVTVSYHCLGFIPAEICEKVASDLGSGSGLHQIFRYPPYHRICQSPFIRNTAGEVKIIFRIPNSTGCVKRRGKSWRILHFRFIRWDTGTWKKQNHL